MSESTTRPDDGTQQLVVIGASAGGVDALIALVETLAETLPAPVIVAQHLDPSRPSQLAAVLSSRSRLPIVAVSDREPLRPGTIYVIPSDRDVEVTDHHVALVAPPARGSKPSVDRLLATAARMYGDRLIAIILTGTGHDGADGAQAVKAYGGTVVVQNPETAEFPGMPLSVPPSAVDIVANLDTIGPLLSDLLSGDFSVRSDDDELRRFLEHVREQSSLDFGAYKRPTIVRRLRRRMTAVGVDSLADYRHYLDRHPEELHDLISAFLIKFTRFFRDQELFEELRTRILPELIAEARRLGELRIWSAGCATGEEAYSVAMLVADLLGYDPELFPVRIFATDIAPDAVEFARRGVYPAASLSDVPAELVSRHFLQIDGSYEVRASVRSMLVFGEHDLAHRAPFPRIDLVLCRNVLIYFTPELQRRALQLFAFSLRRGGYLVLGKSESVSPLPQFFSLEDARQKVFRRVGAAMPIGTDQVLDVAATGAVPMRPTRPLRLPRANPLAFRAAEQPTAQRADILLDELASGVATVDHNYDVVTINATARRLLGIQTAAIGEDIVHRATAGLGERLKTAIDGALAGHATSMTIDLRPDLIDGEGRSLAVTCAPLPMGATGPDIDAVLIQLTDATALVRLQREFEVSNRAAARDRDRAEIAVAEVHRLREINQTLAKDQGRLRADLELLQLAHEEAQAAAEEIETLNEEQQATNEELETVNEELHATVEELQATIGELQASNAELTARQSQLEAMALSLEEQRRASEAGRAQLHAILSTMNDAVLVIDGHGQPVLTNTAYDALLLSAGAGGLLDDHGAALPDEQWPRQRLARGESFTQRFALHDASGARRQFEAIGQVISPADGAGAGVVVIRELANPDHPMAVG